MALRDEEAVPVRKRKRRAKQTDTTSLLVVLGCAAVFVVAVLLVGGTLGVLWAMGVFSKSTATDKKTDTPAGSGSGSKTPTQKPRERLLGQWECMPPEAPGAKMTLDVRQGGKLTLTGTNKGNTAVLDGTWEVLSETTDRLTIRLQFSSAPQPQEWDIELLPNDEMRVNFLSGASPPVTYKRKR
jgi:hypothetical protein